VTLQPEVVNEIDALAPNAACAEPAATMLMARAATATTERKPNDSLARDWLMTIPFPKTLVLGRWSHLRPNRTIRQITEFDDKDWRASRHWRRTRLDECGVFPEVKPQVGRLALRGPSGIRTRGLHLERVAS
jgi:hypothetical protein